VRKAHGPFFRGARAAFRGSISVAAREKRDLRPEREHLQPEEGETFGIEHSPNNGEHGDTFAGTESHRKMRLLAEETSSEGKGEERDEGDEAVGQRESYRISNVQSCAAALNSSLYSP